MNLASAVAQVSKPGFQTCCVADFQVGSAVEFGWPADLEILRYNGTPYDRARTGVIYPG